MKKIKASTVNELFIVTMVGLVVLSILWGYWRIMILHDFEIFTTGEEDVADSLELPDGSLLDEYEEETEL